MIYHRHCRSVSAIWLYISVFCLGILIICHLSRCGRWSRCVGGWWEVLNMVKHSLPLSSRIFMNFHDFSWAETWWTCSTIEFRPSWVFFLPQKFGHSICHCQAFRQQTGVPQNAEDRTLLMDTNRWPRAQGTIYASKTIGFWSPENIVVI